MPRVSALVRLHWQPTPLRVTLPGLSASTVIRFLLRGHGVETTIERQSVNIYVGNLPFSFDSDDLQRLFAPRS